MTQPILHQLANRGSGFLWPRFPVEPLFVPVVLTEYALAVYNGLKLGDTTTDYYLLGPLHALNAAPWILEEVAAVDELIDIAAYPIPPNGWSGGALVGNSQGPAVFSRLPTSWPVDPRITVAFVSTTKARISTGDNTWLVSASEAQNGQIQIEWPAEFQAAGAIDPSITWQAGAVIEINHQPGGYPYAAVVEKVSALRATNRLLLEQGLATAWQGARSPVERTALMALGLIKSFRVTNEH